MGKHPTSFRMNEILIPLMEKYTARFGGQSKAVTSVFLCYDTMMRIERRRLKEIFTQQEIDLMLNNALSTAYLPQTIPGAVLADTEDEIDATLKFYEVDRAVILEKLRGLTLSQQYALVDWITELKGGDPAENEDKK